MQNLSYTSCLFIEWQLLKFRRSSIMDHLVTCCKLVYGWRYTWNDNTKLHKNCIFVNTSYMNWYFHTLVFGVAFDCYQSKLVISAHCWWWMQILVLVHGGIPLLCIESCLLMSLIAWTTNKTGLNLSDYQNVMDLFSMSSWVTTR